MGDYPDLEMSDDGATPCFHLHTTTGILIANSHRDDFREDRWQHLAGVFDGDEVVLYINGSKAASGGSRAAFKVNTQQTGNVRFGAISDEPNRYFTGLIDDVMVYNRALTRTEVLRLSRGKELSE